MKKPTPFGKYYLLERINVGGMAEVFRAKAFGVEGFERLVAVKRILPNIAEDKEFIRMFIEEAKLAVQLNHANIAQIFDLGVVDGSYYIALEHIHGRDLRAMFDRCRQQGEPMPVSQACFVVMKVCEGLDYAHNKRDQGGRELHLVHRDVSPQNVLVSFEGEVKLIDFGIAKAAGKGSKTQAGILKGKFGYMSPEQVRGIPLDRRSDVFSAGIVLYELLTGERLFVGESDFSTLEKVRNVEILPPSTYNRRIPDELERIVLKALARDPEERYQNAIDLHDELQAFVYTAGEFYSRKDLAGWMKKMFGREIEDETAKLESFRQLKAPASADQAGPVGARTASGTRPPPPRSSSPTGAPKSPPPVPRPSNPGPSQEVAAQAKPRRGAGLDADSLAWDDDELETQIYDNAEDATNARRARPSAPPPTGPTGSAGQPGAAGAGATPASAPAPAAAAQAATGAGGATSGAGPDLSSLVTTGKAWGDGPAPTTKPPPSGGTGPQPALAAGSSRGPAPRPPEDPLASLAASYAAPAASPGREAVPAAGRADASFEPMASFGQGMLARQARSRGASKTALGIGVAAAVVVAVVVIIAMTGGGKKTSTSASATTTPPAPPAAPQGDANTGFDLYVTPAGTLTWRLDGEARTDRLPSRIRGISPGKHVVAIDAPPGFMSQNMPVDIALGTAPRIDIVLQPLDVAGTFESTPPGATVWLIVDGKRETLGPSPAKAKLDPRRSYQVLFEKPGYVSVNRPIVFSGALEQTVAVTLDRSGATAAAAPKAEPAVAVARPESPRPDPKPVAGPVTRPERTSSRPEVKPEAKPEVKPEVKPEPPKPEPATSGTGTLLLGSKPPCEIYIDGKATGLSTPQRDIKLAAGKHRITLVNNEYGIKESFSVEIKPDAVEKQIKDFSDRLPK